MEWLMDNKTRPRDMSLTRGTLQNDREGRGEDISWKW
jgi:hypothetical protein